MKRFPKSIGWILLAGLLLCMPLLFGKDYYLHMFVMAGIYAILAVSLALIMGFTGQVSLCHATFFGIGAYTSALVSLNFGLSFWITLWLGGGMGALVSWALGRLVLRLKGHFLAITTAFFGVMVAVVLNNWVGLTKGPMGLPGIPRPTPIPLPGFRVEIATRAHYYYLVLILLGLVLYVAWRIVRSRLGKAMVAIRENEELAQSIGIESMRYKLFSFCLGGGIAGLAGAFYAHYILFISPVTFNVGDSINIVVMVIFGGMTTLSGPVLGAVILTLLPEFLRMAGALRLVIYGLALMIFIIWMPLGVVGTVKDFLQTRRKTPTTGEA
jgi:branched-chain amino acid transport system permease protein